MIFKWFGPIALLAALVIGDQINDRPAHKYRLTVEVETPEGRKSASGVLAVHPDRSYTRRGRTRTLGDAVFVDLGQGKNLVALLAHIDNKLVLDDMNYVALRAYVAASGKRVPFSEMSRLTGVVPVKGELIPVLVSFADPATPGSARVVRSDDAEAVLGKGYRIQSISAEVVPNGYWPLDFGGPLGEPVTRGIGRRNCHGWRARRCGGRGARRGRVARGRRDRCPRGACGCGDTRLCRIPALLRNRIPRSRARATLGASVLPEGRAYYADLVRHFTTLPEATPEGIHDIGVGEVARIRGEMEAILRDLNHAGDLSSFLVFLRNDPQFRAKTAEDLLREAAWIAKEIDGRLPDYFGKLPRMPYAVKSVPEALAPNYTAGRYNPGRWGPPASTGSIPMRSIRGCSTHCPR